MILLPIKIDPGAVVPVAAYGQFVYFESATGPGDTSIVVKAQGGSGVDYILKVGQGFRTDEAFSQLIISNNKGEGTITGVVVVADQNFFDNRVVGTVSIAGTVGVNGVVEVVDGGRARVLANKAFMAYADMGAADKPVHQLWNPAGSGKNVVIESVTVSSGSVNTVRIAFASAAAANMAAQPALSKKNGVAGSIAEVRQVINPTFLTNPIYVAYVSTAAQVLAPKEPFVLTPGNGLSVQGQNANGNMVTIFEYYEEAV
ncbi:hypothetical protein RC55_07180 [Herbaspirillum seropedicae]|uniref:hypothetical protein n=2 Tax=Herbaspirillum seropedicae TaxID=964 RepID=UPI0006526D49|nr:hypothetical protein [Herbaspirillum seropedicae]AKN65861.1 hypothetical protein ACP92_11830 [Herbaspirillum seropedicae]NQE29013.1 hypothetical protein [Herbaspirillum seropedicae]